MRQILWKDCSFDWHRLPQTISVIFGPPPGALGYYSHDDATLRVWRRMPGDGLAWLVAHEMAHAADHGLLTDGDRERIAAAWHPEGADEHEWWDGEVYEDRMAENFTAVFQTLYCPSTVQGSFGNHEVTPEVLETVKSVLSA